MHLAQSRQASFATKNLPAAWLFLHITEYPLEVLSSIPEKRATASEGGLKAFRGLRKTTQKPTKEWTLWPHSNKSEPLLSLFVNSSQKGMWFGLDAKKRTCSQTVRAKVWSSNSTEPEILVLAFLVG